MARSIGRPSRAAALQLAFDPGAFMALARSPAPRRQAPQAPAAAPTPPGPATMRPTERGLGFVKAYEKFEPKVYRTDGANTPTIGWGHVVRPDEPFTDGITRQEADLLFDDEMNRHADLVRRRVKVPLTPQQFDALSSLAYNAPSAFSRKSSLLTALNAGDYAGAGEAILKYDHAGGMRLDGLTKRRRQERAMFLNGDYTSDH